MSFTMQREGNRYRVLTAFLAILALAQVTVIALRGLDSNTSEGPAPDIRRGDTIKVLKAVDPQGKSYSFRIANRENPVLLVALHSDCAHCQNVAPHWTSWWWQFSQPSARYALPFSIVAVGREPRDSAIDFLDRYQLALPFVQLDAKRGSLESGVLKRTPWLFFFDKAGVVQFEGHGNRLQDIDVLMALAEMKTIVGRTPNLQGGSE